MTKPPKPTAPAPLPAAPEEVDVMAQKNYTRKRSAEAQGRNSTMLQKTAAPASAKKTVLG